MQILGLCLQLGNDSLNRDRVDVIYQQLHSLKWFRALLCLILLDISLHHLFEFDELPCLVSNVEEEIVLADEVKHLWALQAQVVCQTLSRLVISNVQIGEKLH
jgi:hypothetical protein